MRRMRISDEGLMNLGFAVHLSSMFTFRQGNSDVASDSTEEGECGGILL